MNIFLKKIEKLSKLDPNSDDFKNIIKKSDSKINKYYKILSYHKFVSLCKDCKIKLKNHILIIDEIQNMISETGTFYSNLKKQIDSIGKTTRIVLLSATPMFDKPVEIALTLNLLKPEKELPIGFNFNKKFYELKKEKMEFIINLKI